MSSVALLEHTIVVNAGLPLVWAERTDVSTWHDPPAEFRLDGPFVDGARGETLMTGQEPVRWQVRDVRAPDGYTVDVPVEGAIIAFEWAFAEIGPERTRVTQRISISGENAEAYAEHVRHNFGATIDDGMKRLGAQLEASARAEQARDQ